MNTKITEDCYVNVEGWTKEEVQRAAEFFAEALGAEIASISVVDRYIYLMFLDCGDVFVGDLDDIQEHNRYKELTKEDIFGTASEEEEEDISTTSKLTLQSFKEFTTLFDGVDISFINGSARVTHWPETDILEYLVETEEELQEVVGAMKVLDKYRKNKQEMTNG